MKKRNDTAELSAENVTTKRKSKMIGWIALGITLAIFALIALRIDDWGRDWTQNTAELDANAERVGLRPVERREGFDETTALILDWVDSSPRLQLVSQSDTGKRPVRLHLTRTTPLMRFVDDIEVTIQQNPDAEGVIVFASSRSRVGKGDLGQNPRNLIELTTMLRGNSTTPNE